MDKFYDKIEDYLNGELEAQEVEAFEIALGQDAQLRAAVGQTSEVIEQLNGMRRRGTIKKNMQPPPVQGALSVANRRLLAIAATLLLIAAATYFLREFPSRERGMASEQNTQLPKPNEQPIALEPSKGDTAPSRPDVVPGSGKPPSPTDESGKVDPKIRLAYNDAVGRLEKLAYVPMGEAQKDAALEQKLNQAIALLKTEKPAEAIALLESVAAFNNPLYGEDTEWLLSLAWLLRNPAKGKARLNAIAQDPAHTYRADALRLLRALD